MYRTDKQFMKNPATAPSRIYIGNIAETVVAADLEEKFQVHGKILGLVLQRGFGFIQFETETQAHSAISEEHGITFHGRRMNVKQAIGKNQGNQPPNQQQATQNNAPPPPTPKQPLLPEPEPQNTTASQVMSNVANTSMDVAPPPTTASVDDSNNLVAAPNSYHSSETESQPPLNKSDSAAYFSNKNDGPPEKRKRRNMRGGLRDRDRGDRDRHLPPMDNYREMPPFYGRDDPYGPGYVPPIIDRPERNDCEIIVVSKPLTEYAEYIEQRLKGMGLIVDLLFPNEDVPIGRVLANISSRGCLYAILVMPQNEEHRSLTLNILHGIPQEHRNMPFEDAIILITRNFAAYMRGEKTGPVPDSGSLLDRHPESIQMLLNLLAENRQLSAVQYDKLLKYLGERRELQIQHERTEGVDSVIEPDPNSKQAELQSRIMNILNKSNDSPSPVAPPITQPVGVTPSPLLQDPSVQKALDSLLSGEMFKSISAGI